ncbi:MAG: NADH:flavin oxidoreductase/NADH oxidase [Vicinamibacterales bacterium]
MPHLFDPLTLRGTTFAHRIFVSPMCQYSALDGLPNDWHFAHLAARAVGGAALVLTEATAVAPDGRISPEDTGLWNDAQTDAFARIVGFLRAQGSHVGVQLAHAGRKASTVRPWEGTGTIPLTDGGWKPVAPSPIAFAGDYAVPRALSHGEIEDCVRAFRASAIRAREAGFSVVEIHAAHGYLLHEFLSPLSNQRDDEYGGSFENRTRMVRDVVAAVRDVWPDHLPLFVRISATDWAEGGWDLEQSIALAKRFAQLGVDLVDASSGGLVSTARVPVGPGYQTGFAAAIRQLASIPTGAVGLITSPLQADHIVRSGQADCVFLARELLRDPYWPLAAARELGHPVAWPAQYLRAAPPGSQARQMLPPLP